MRMKLVTVLAFVSLISSPVWAGTLNSGADGAPTWQSTQCTEPTAPQDVVKANREARANNMNALMKKHNEYVEAVQAYMDCVSNEALNDANAISGAITQSAQQAIDDAAKKVGKVARHLQAPSSDAKDAKPKITAE